VQFFHDEAVRSYLRYVSTCDARGRGLASFPQCLSIMSVGAELREARERAGLSREDISQGTKIQLAKIESLESDRFDRLPEGIDLDGLVRAYATAVGLDGSCMVTRMHQQLALGVSAVDPFADSEFISELEQSHAANDEVVDLHLRPTESAESLPPLEHVDRVDLIVPPTPKRGAEVIASPAFLASTQLPPPRRSVGRFVIPLLLLFAAFALGAFLYDRNQPFGAQADELTLAVAHDDEASAARAAANNANNPAQPIGPDAVPADRPATSEHHADDSPPASDGAAAIKPGAPAPGPASTTPGTSDTPPAAAHAPAASSTPEARPAPAPARPTTPTALPASPASPAPPALPAPPLPAPAPAVTNLSGSWTLDTRVESSSVRDFEGLHLGYRLELHQSGDRVTGEGVKLLENGKRIVDFAQTPIVVTGTIEGSRLILTFTERGRRRETGGKMILDVHEDGVLRGRFASSAARSTGLVEARRGRS
jgi:hypothetical protein